MIRMGPALARIGQPSPAMAGSATATAPSGSIFVCSFLCSTCKEKLVSVDDDVVDFLAPYLCAPAPSPAAKPEAESPDFLEQLLAELIDEHNSNTEEQAVVQVEQQEWNEV